MGSPDGEKKAAYGRVSIEGQGNDKTGPQREPVIKGDGVSESSRSVLMSIRLRVNALPLVSPYQNRPRSWLKRAVTGRGPTIGRA